MAISLAAEPIFTVLNIPVTNSMINGWLATGFFLIVSLILYFGAKPIPGKFQNAVEGLFEFMLGFMDNVTGSREKSKKFFPIVATLFFFILISNWAGLLPGVGSIGVTKLVHGANEFIPLFRPATSDINTTLALGVLAVVSTHLFGIFTIGFFTHWNKFIQLGSIAKAFIKFFKKPGGDSAIGIFQSLVEFVVGLIELAAEAAKTLSLALRLFGNIFAGEVLLAVISSLVSVLMPTPFMLMELIVGAVQALVFSMLTLVYLNLATEASHGSESHAPAIAAH